MVGESAAVTFLFTDIEGSTRLWEESPARMRVALACHDALARSAVEQHRGTVVKTTGDGVHAAFAQPNDALAAVVQMQLALTDPEATAGMGLRVRCGLHAGPHERRDAVYGPEVNRAARITSAAHGGQILLSQAVAELVRDRLPADVTLRDLGAVRLRDLSRPERVWQLDHARLPVEFPPLRSLAATPNNLWQQLNTFIGRDREMAESKRLLAEHRLLTLVGAGGIGKTRLSLQLAADVLDGYPDGVWFVDLAALTDPRLVAQALASVLGVKEEAGRPVVDALLKYVGDRAMLVILDNCEHVLHACAELAKALQSGPALLHPGLQPRAAAGRRRDGLSGAGIDGARAGCRPGAGGRDPPRRAAAVHRPGSGGAARVRRERAQRRRHGRDLPPAGRDSAGDRARRGPRAVDSGGDDRRAAQGQLPPAAHRRRDGAATAADAARADRLERRPALRARAHVAATVVGLCRRVDARGRRVRRRGGRDRRRRRAGTPQCAGGKVAGGDGCRRRALPVAGNGAPVRAGAPAGGRRSGVGPRSAPRVLPGIRRGGAARAGGAGAGALDGPARRRSRKPARGARGCRSGGRVPSSACASCAALRRYWIHRGLGTLGYRLTVEALARAGGPEHDLARYRGLFGAGQFAHSMGRYTDAQRHLDQAAAIARGMGDTTLVAKVLQPLGLAGLGAGDFALARRHLDEALDLARGLGDKRELLAASSALAQLHRMEGRLDAALLLSRNAGAGARTGGPAEHRHRPLL
ncbi:MAG: tetratricopeptide repeat protein [Betaproteobacteria bacterium]|nr:tetratricopeptide repeat protein [Betaproteobacteria bacterium]